MILRSFEKQDAEGFLRIYEDSFPIDERRCYDGVTGFLEFYESRVQFNILVAEEHGEVVGFLSYWRFPDYCYVEHLAVESRMRGSGIGRELMQYLITTVSERVLLEVEPPLDEMSRRRIAFYERLGFGLHSDYYYLQPPYGPGQSPVELKLMTTPTVIAPNACMLAPLLREVYGVGE